jgi:hypothetical protein
MITPVYAMTATERILPKLTLDWTTGLAQPSVDVVRAGVATFVGSNGLIQSATANTQRIDYSTGTPALLVEEQRTNLVTYSEQFDNINWTKVSSTITDNTVIAPDGTLTADTITAITNSGYVTRGGFPVTNSTLSVYVKQGVGTRFSLGTSGASNDDFAIFNLGTGTVVSTGANNVAASITSVGNGWYRLTVTRGATLGTAIFIGFLVSGATTNDYHYIWGSQVEAALSVSSYIPTELLTVTRNADVATMTGTNFTSWYNAKASTFLAQVIPSSISGVRPLVSFDDNTANNLIQIRGNAANPELYIKATTDQAQLDAGTIVANNVYKLAASWGQDSCSASKDTGVVVVDSSATIPTVTQLRIGNDSTNYFNGRIQKIEYWNIKFVNSGLQVLSGKVGAKSLLSSIFKQILF